MGLSKKRCCALAILLSRLSSSPISATTSHQVESLIWLTFSSRMHASSYKRLTWWILDGPFF